MATKKKAFPCERCEFTAKSNAGLSQHKAAHQRQVDAFTKMREGEAAKHPFSNPSVTTGITTSTGTATTYRLLGARVIPIPESVSTASSGASAEQPTTKVDPKPLAVLVSVVDDVVVVCVPAGTKTLITYA